ncbi:MAG TPA: hypothetical protein VK177_06610 [Flavobacteriales bacterium]|nr:hypothetical protein [Flavobacteriales bacterium]
MSQLQDFYPVFEGNQVLTSTQLNQLVNYLDEQNRVTRAKLIGQGIVCGLDVSTAPDSITKVITIKISQGMGVTSAGYLIAQCDQALTQYKEYIMPDGVQYAPFEDPQTKTQDVKLYELVPADYVPIPGETLRPLNNPVGFLNDKVVLLFLECNEIDLKSCLGMSCDERGKVMEMTVRKLLISKKELEEKVFPRTCQQDGLYPEQYDLAEIEIRRVLFNPVSAHSNNYFQFSENYINAIRGNGFVSNTASSTVYDQLFVNLRQTYVDFAAILSPVYGGVNPFAAYPDASWTQFLNGTSAGPRYLGVQYFYDFIKDLILAYDEFRDNALNLMSGCCMNMNCFPKHLMLGEALPPVLTKPSRYRHGWELSPAFNGQKELLNKVIMLHKRMVLMVRKFNLAQINNPNIIPISPAPLGTPVLITPSKEKIGPLSERSMPYYYKVNEADGQLGTLEQNWDYEFIRRYLFAKGLTPLGYGNQSTNQVNDQGPVATPLYYNTDAFNFLRIEGAIRQNYVTVKTEIESLKQRFDLPFDIKVLRLAGNPLDDIDDRCDFSDLRTGYGTMRVHLRDMMQRILSRWQSNEFGIIRRKPLPAFMLALIADNNSGSLLGSIQQPQTGFGASPGGGGGADGGLVFEVFGPIYAPQRTMQQALQYFNQSIDQVLASITTILQSKLPFNLSDFKFGYTGNTQDTTPGFIQHYITALQNAINAKVGLNQLMDLIIRSSKMRDTPEIYFDVNNYMQEILGELEWFIKDSTHRELMLLAYQFQYRFNYLKSHDQTLFSNFIQKNPGIEHAAGVKPGGTYIMVVPGNNVTIDVEQHQFVVQEFRNAQADKVELEYLQAIDIKTTEDFERIGMLTASVDSFERIKDDMAFGVAFDQAVVPAQTVLIQPGQVIADFSLPYLCCCDCECDDIPHPKTQAELNMPALAYPFYAEYSLGDYAFGHDMFVTRTSAGELEIFVLEALQFERSIYDQSRAKIYLVSKSGIRMNYNFPLDRESSSAAFVDLSPMTTYNTPNDPFNSIPYGTAKIRQYAGFGPRIVYTPRPGNAGVQGFHGIDSFYYMYEILDDAGNVVRRSGMGQVTVLVEK